MIHKDLFVVILYYKLIKIEIIIVSLIIRWAMNIRITIITHVITYNKNIL